MPLHQQQKHILWGRSSAGVWLLRKGRQQSTRIQSHACLFAGSGRTGTPPKSSHNETSALLLSIDPEGDAGRRRAVVVQGCMGR